MIFHRLKAYAPFVAGYAEFFVFCKGIDHAGDEADELSKHCCDCRSCGTHFKRNEKQEIKTNIESGGNHKKYKRRHRVADRAKNAAYKIITHLRCDTYENYQAVCICGVIDFPVCRCHVNYAEHPRKKCDRKNCEQDGNRKREIYLCRKRTTRSLGVSASDASGCDYTESGSASESEL